MVLKTVVYKKWFYSRLLDWESELLMPILESDGLLLKNRNVTVPLRKLEQGSWASMD